MTTITQYKAKDGKLFDDPDDCLKHEQLLKCIDSALYLLNPIPTTMAFVNGDGYVQQNLATVELVKNKLLDLWPHDAEIVRKARENPARNSIIARIWCDNGTPLYKAWTRLLCVDEHGREFGQPYFASHPREATLTAL